MDNISDGLRVFLAVSGTGFFMIFQFTNLFQKIKYPTIPVISELTLRTKEGYRQLRVFLENKVHHSPTFRPRDRMKRRYRKMWF